MKLTECYYRFFVLGDWDGVDRYFVEGRIMSSDKSALRRARWLAGGVPGQLVGIEVCRGSVGRDVVGVYSAAPDLPVCSGWLGRCIAP